MTDKQLRLPFPPLETVVTDDPLDWETIYEEIGSRLAAGVSFVVLRSRGPEDRGGYFFHIKQVADGLALFTFEGERALLFPTGDACAEYINHAAGLAYSEEMWERAQQANLKTQPEQQ